MGRPTFRHSERVGLDAAEKLRRHSHAVLNAWTFPMATSHGPVVLLELKTRRRWWRWWLWPVRRVHALSVIDAREVAKYLEIASDRAVNMQKKAKW